MAKAADFAEWRGKLAGGIVLVSQPDTGSERAEAPFQKLNAEALGKLDEFKQPNYSPAAIEKMLKGSDFDAQRANIQRGIEGGG